jgi:hypothetical protein
MKLFLRPVFGLAPCLALCTAVACIPLHAQSPAYAPAAVNAQDNSGPVVLDWVPPALAELQSQATSKSSFSLDRNMLNAAAGAMPDSDADVKQAVNKLDGLSVHVLRFAADGAVDRAQVEAVRQAYHLRGWKHVVTTTNSGGPVHNNSSDVWVVMDGTNLRGAVVLSQTPRSLTLVTVAGNLSPVDLLHLRGHFGIPRFDGDNLAGSVDR